MKTIIAIWNRSNVGKTESIRQFTKQLLNTYPKCQPLGFLVPESGDFQVEVAIGETKIGIISQGDPGTNLAPKIRSLIKSDCQFIVCSTRTRGADVNNIISLAAKSGWNIVWSSSYEPQLDSYQKTMNVLKGKHILDMINILKLEN